MKKINIAIDGPSAAGKSTIARNLAKELQYSHLDTGAMYRCCALQTLRHHIALDDEAGIVALLKQSNINVLPSGQVFLNGEDVSDAIRQNDMSMVASTISKHPKVREELVRQQQVIAKQKGYILDGRDIGSVVLPDAEVKIYQTASVETRALRRFKEYQDNHLDCLLEEIEEDIRTRDEQDMNRSVSPLIKVEDAFELDTSRLTVEESVGLILTLVKNKIESM